MASKRAKNLFGKVSCLLVLSGAICVLPSAQQSLERPGLPLAVAPQVQEHYGKLPLSFEENQGQVDGRAKFLARGRGYTLFLTPGEAVLALGSRADQTVLRMRLVGANSHPEMAGLEELPGKANYFIGNDPKKWRTNVPTYAKVAYKDVYPGVNLVYYGNQRRLEHDFVVQSGADPRTIRVEFQGADTLRVNDSGDLVLQAGGGQVLLRKPIIYQKADAGRQEISGRYLVMGPNQVGFQVGAYDARRTLIIDPVLDYSTYLGGAGDDKGNAIAVDAAGNAYVTGQTTSNPFPTTASAFDSSFNGGAFICGATDAFVAKLNAAGSALVYSTYLGGSSGDVGFGIAIDTSGNAYVTGSTCSSDFPKANPFQSSFGGGTTDAFVTKLNSTGSALLYSTYLAGAGFDEGMAIAVDSSNKAYVTGHTDSSGFPTKNPLSGQSVFQGGGSDAFVAKLDPSQSGALSLVYSTFLGGIGTDKGLGIAVDGSGNAYVTGSTDSFNDFPTMNPLQSQVVDANDAFVTKLNADVPPAITYSTYLGGSCNDVGQGIAVDTAGNAYVTGTTGASIGPPTVLCSSTSNTFPTLHPLQGTFAGGNTFNASDAFVTKIDTTESGSASLVYSTFLGGTGDDLGLGIALDSAGNAFITGHTTSSNFPTKNPFQASNGGVRDAFFTKLDPSQNGAASLVFSTYLGGSGDDQGFGIAVDSAGAAYVTGSTSGSFPTSVAPFDATFGGGATDAFVAKLLETTTPGTLQFSAATYSVKENGGSATITVARTGGWRGGVTVHYATSDGTATAGSDYKATSGTLNFNAGDESKTFTIPIINDALAEENKTVNLTLSNPTPTGQGGAVLGAQNTAVLTIVNDDLGGTLQFSSATYSVRESGPVATITVTRSGGSANGVTVDYATSDGTATAGADYTATSGTLTFLAGQTSRPFTILIIDDALAEGYETVNLTLSNPTTIGPSGAAAVLGARRTAVLTIVDNDVTNGLLQFSAATYSVKEGAGSATITVTRSVSTAGPVTVDYATSDGTATAGADYTATSGTLSFAAGQASQPFTIPITEDAVHEGPETVNLTLSNPTGGDGLGTRRTAVLTIVDND